MVEMRQSNVLEVISSILQRKKLDILKKTCLNIPKRGTCYTQKDTSNILQRDV